MEVDEIQCKFPRMSNEEEEGDQNHKTAVDLGRFYGWPSSRIVRVSRASGGKDRHSKVLTSKGLRDRRVRLSVNTAIQFYDLQDRLGYDQPSKAVEWLLKAAADSIAELPPISCSLFSDATNKQISDDKRSDVDMDDDSAAANAAADPSSASENSKNSGGLSLSRSENRVKARERAKGRVAEKEKDNETMNPNSQISSFTELLSGGIGNNNNNSSTRQWCSTTPPMDYFTSTGLMAAAPLFSVAEDNQHQHQQHLGFVPDHHHQFTISSSNINSSGFNGGTLQSNSSSTSHHQLQRFNNNSAIINVDGSVPSFFMENHHHHQFLSGFDGRGLHLYYGDANNAARHSEHKEGKGKN